MIASSSDASEEEARQGSAGATRASGQQRVLPPDPHPAVGSLWESATGKRRMARPWGPAPVSAVGWTLPHPVPFPTPCTILSFLLSQHKSTKWLPVLTGRESSVVTTQFFPLQ